jgi:hypothetical protein
MMSEMESGWKSEIEKRSEWPSEKDMSGMMKNDTKIETKGKNHHKSGASPI